MTSDIIKSKSRVRDHGEVYTPDFIVSDMLDLVKHETERIDSRFLEPACGDGNFLIQVLQRKLQVVKNKYQKHQFDYEKNIILAIASIYGIDLLEDNVHTAQERLYNLIESEYTTLYKNNCNSKVLHVIRYILSKNIIQGDALSLKDTNNKSLVFAERSYIDGSKIKRRDFVFDELINTAHGNNSLWWTLFSDTNEPVFIPHPIKEYPPLHFLELYQHDDSTQL